MKCVICGTTIGNRETRSHVLVYSKSRPCRKLFACSTCGIDKGPLDRLIDALPVNSDGNPLDVCRAELEALKLATDRKRLEKRLRAASAVLEPATRRNFGRGHFNFLRRQLIGNNGAVLQWRTRKRPDKPDTFHNQQTTEGNVSFTV